MKLFMSSTIKNLPFYSIFNWYSEVVDKIK